MEDRYLFGIVTAIRKHALDFFDAASTIAAMENITKEEGADMIIEFSGRPGIAPIPRPEPSEATRKNDE